MVQNNIHIFKEIPDVKWTNREMPEFYKKWIEFAYDNMEEDRSSKK